MFFSKDIMHCDVASVIYAKEKFPRKKQNNELLINEDNNLFYVIFTLRPQIVGLKLRCIDTLMVSDGDALLVVCVLLTVICALHSIRRRVLFSTNFFLCYFKKTKKTVFQKILLL